MSFRYALAILATGFGLATVSAQQPAKPEATVYRLRNTAAIDVAKAVTTYATQAKLAITIVAEPVSNSVFVAGDPDPYKKVIEMIAKFDKLAPRVHMQMMIFEVPAGFAEDVGLGEGDNWVLTPREARMLNATIRREMKDGDIDILSRPQVTSADNMPVYFQVGSDTTGMKSRVTTRISPDGESVLLQLEIDGTSAAEGGGSETHSQTMKTTAMVPNGGTLMVRGARSKTADGGTRERYVLMTVKPVSQESDRR